MPFDMDEVKGAFEDAAREMKGKLSDVSKAQKEMAEKMADLEGKQVEGDDITDIKSRVEDSSKQLEELGEQVIDLTKKQNQKADEHKTLGRVIAEQKDFRDRIMSRETLEMKDVTAASFAPSTLPGGHRRDHRGFVEPTNQRLTLRNILPNGTTNAAVLEYDRELLFTNNADVVAEGALKPQSELTFQTATAVMQKLAHWFRVTEERLDDVDGMEAYINQRGIYGLLLREEEKLINGTGGGTDIDGLALPANHTAYVNTTVPDVTPVNAMDDIRVAIAQVEESDLMASAVIMNHLDAAALDLTKDADGNYLHPAFTGDTAWGLPVARTKSIPQGMFMVGGFQGNVMLWQKKGLEVRRSTEDRDNFVTNKVTILVEERIGLEVLRPAGLIYGALS